MSKVILIAICAEDTAHGRDIKTKEATANGSEAAYGIYGIESLPMLVRFS